MSSGRRRPRSLYTTLDVLTDGSEHTGHGSLFLSVWKGPILPSSTTTTEVNNDGVKTTTEWMAEASLLARYNISGLGDATARLCADQRFKLANVRLTVLPSPSSFGPAANADGLSALLYALVGAGSPSLHVVLPPNWRKEENYGSSVMEEMATLILGKHKYLDIRTCRVPAPSITLSKGGGSDSDEKEAAAAAAAATTTTMDWWRVYHDEYLEAHAGFYLENVGSNGNDEKSVEDDGGTTTPAQLDIRPLLIYLFSFPRHSSGFTTLMVLPPKCHDVTSVYRDVIQKDLPLVRDGHRMKVDHMVALDPLVSHSTPLDQPPSLPCTFMATLPRTSIDEGALIRSQQLARYFHHHMPWAFSAPSDPSSTVLHPTTASAFRVLKSGTSVLFMPPDQSTSVVWEDRVIDRRAAISGSSLREEWTSTLESLQSFVPQPPSCEDENEIDIDEEDEMDDKIKKKEGPSNEATTNTYDAKPRSHLIVLGTGCATPSASRGSSSYALVRPSIQENGKETQEIYLLDCGEGAATMLSRNCGPLTDWKRQIHGIWISHAHLDHYGGLPTLLRVLHEAKGASFATRRAEDVSSAKRPKHIHDTTVPWVMAPPKVFRYLDILLQSRHGRSTRDNHTQFFHPLQYHDPNVPSGNWMHFENIKVNHSCCPSFGLLLGWKPSGSNDAPVFLCYSGDTRPCFGLVQACRSALRRCHNHRNHQQHGSLERRRLFLIHEATFDDTEGNDAEKKKHSTLSEAVQVANDIPASKLLLTHFSQRYVSLSHRANIGSNSNGGDNVPTGLATDGLWVLLE